MNARVAYYSATGNTRKVAAAIASAVGADAVDIASYVPDSAPVDVLFIGAAVYATHDHGVHKTVKDFIAGLDPESVKRAAIFSTGFIQSEATAMLRGLLTGRGIPVAEESFFCLGRFALFNLGHPNAKDLEAAAAFGKEALGNATR
ncbi:MAG: flavodoxin [Spirochaetae bacterium HGW-Spirochaetae-3]|jgi:flavodoxin|nr:MAG: flavodoxin [Spirochaetae bacterium HGW-Spirochaetae-3]